MLLKRLILGSRLSSVFPKLMAKLKFISSYVKVITWNLSVSIHCWCGHKSTLSMIHLFLVGRQHFFKKDAQSKLFEKLLPASKLSLLPASLFKEEGLGSSLNHAGKGIHFSTKLIFHRHLMLTRHFGSVYIFLISEGIATNLLHCCNLFLIF